MSNNILTETAINYVKDRVESVVRCTNGKISTELSEKRKSYTLDVSEKLAQVRNKKAVLKKNEELFIDFDLGYGKCLNALFNFKRTKEQISAEIFNKTLESQEEERHTEVELAGKRLVDKTVLGIIELKYIPEELEKLARMADE